MSEKSEMYMDEKSIKIYTIQGKGIVKDLQVFDYNQNILYSLRVKKHTVFGKWIARLSSNDKDIIEISQAAYSLKYTISDLKTGSETKFQPFGLMTKKYQFIGSDGILYAWFGNSHPKPLELIECHSEKVVAVYDRDNQTDNSGKLRVEAHLKQMLPLILSTAYCANNWMHRG